MRIAVWLRTAAALLVLAAVVATMTTRTWQHRIVPVRDGRLHGAWRATGPDAIEIETTVGNQRFGVVTGYRGRATARDDDGNATAPMESRRTATRSTCDRHGDRDGRRLDLRRVSVLRRERPHGFSSEAPSAVSCAVSAANVLSHPARALLRHACRSSPVLVSAHVKSAAMRFATPLPRPLSTFVPTFRIAL